MKKQIKALEESCLNSSAPNEPSTTPLPQYLLDRSNPTNAKALSSAIKNKRNEKAAKFSVPLPKVRAIAEEELFTVVQTRKKTAKKGISDLPFERLVRPRECPSVALECLQTVTWRYNRAFGGCVAGPAVKHNNRHIFRVEAYDQ